MHCLSIFYSGRYKWSFYERYRIGFALTEIFRISGIIDKPLRKWSRCFDLQYSRACSVILKVAGRKSAQLRAQIERRQAEPRILQREFVLAEILESHRFWQILSLGCAGFICLKNHCGTSFCDRRYFPDKPYISEGLSFSKAFKGFDIPLSKHIRSLFAFSGQAGSSVF